MTTTPPLPPLPPSLPSLATSSPSPPKPRLSIESGATQSHSIAVSSQRRLTRRISRRERRWTEQSLYPGSSSTQLLPPSTRWPYHEYVHQAVGAGWENLTKLDQYMSSGFQDENENGTGNENGNANQNEKIGTGATGTGAGISTTNNFNDFIVSVLDINYNNQKTLWPEIRNVRSLHRFFSASDDGREHDRSRAKIRLFVAEYNRVPPPALIEIFGATLGLDPRFWSWAIHARDHVLLPSDRNRALYTKVGFAVLKEGQGQKRDCCVPEVERAGTMVYVVPDEDGDGWTGLVLFDSRIGVKTSASVLYPPPRFSASIMPRDPCERKSLRELYLESFDFISLESASISPFYAFHTLFRLNNHLWTQTITAIREADHRIHGASSSAIGYAEEIARTKGIIERGGSLVWQGKNHQRAVDAKKELEEDFAHLVEQTEVLWQNRTKMAQVRRRRSTSWASITHAFTSLFPTSHRLRS
ncbi:hypothetical protein F5884DRAFT_786252 [Xylogone sp. PMI_703]|nr:hypothetical protein F5884DRAFT_786252 [Xylogone sp. PMI_703]